MITAATAMITVVGEFCDGSGDLCGGVLTVVSKWSTLIAADCTSFKYVQLCTCQIVHP